MKKLNLKLGSIKEMLSKEEMKKISGGNVWEVYCTVSYWEPPEYEFIEFQWWCNEFTTPPTNEEQIDCDEQCIQHYGATHCNFCEVYEHWS